MSAEFQSIDEAITASYQSASQVETLARQLEARISKIDGAKRHLPHRNYGQPVDLGKISSNLTLTALIAQYSAELDSLSLWFSRHKLKDTTHTNFAYLEEVEIS